MIVAVADHTVYTEQDSIDRDVFIKSSLAWPVSGLHPFHAVVMLNQHNTVCYAAINVPDNNIRAGTVIVDERGRLTNEQITINIYAQLEPLLCRRQEHINFHHQLYSYQFHIITNKTVSSPVTKRKQDGSCNCSIKRELVIDQELMDMVSLEYGIPLSGTHQEKLATLVSSSSIERLRKVMRFGN